MVKFLKLLFIFINSNLMTIIGITLMDGKYVLIPLAFNETNKNAIVTYIFFLVCSFASFSLESMCC